MGKSTASCFKIITCGSDSVDHDDLQTPESKGSSDRRGWSFRKRSARHRVLSNSVSTEAPSSENKEHPESTAVQVQADLTVPEKASVIQPAEEKTELCVQPDSKLSDNVGAREDECRADAILDEHSIIVVQAAIRRWLAQRLLLKQQTAVKLQAAVRGHLVRRHAVGTLRCVQSIVKMQALVRARHARLRLDESGDFVKRKKEAKPNVTYTYVSIEKLLSNAFVRQLMESTPRTKTINIKCEPLKSDSAWKWLERWMSVSMVSKEELQESGSDEEQHKESHESDEVQHKRSLGSDEEQHKESLGHFDGKEDNLVPSDCYSEGTDVRTGLVASAEASKNVDDLSGHEANNLDLRPSTPTSPSSSHSELHNFDQSNSRFDVAQSAPVEMKEKDLIERVEVKSLPEKVEVKSLPEKVEVKDVPDVKKFSAEQPETDVKQFAGKASNPAFVAAQSKFEELSSSTASAKLNTTSSHDTEVESILDKVSSSTDQPIGYKDTGLADSAISNASRAHIGGSECGTEISISSTLDSPDRSYAEVNNIEQETKVSDESDHPRSRENSELDEANGKSITLETDLSYTNTNKLERDESINSSTVESLNSANVVDPPQQEKAPEADTSDLQVELGSEASHLVNKSSPEASPRSHITVPESQATPSSQVSVKPKKGKAEKTNSNRKNKPLSADKKSLSNRNQDSASRSGLEPSQEHKTGKRRNSFGSAKPDHREQEPRDSSSSSSLPSYMQATESARAKAIATGSPRSSPDVHDKDIYIKKRQSLPGANERQGSPRIQRSLSQAQQNAKGNGTHSPQDRKWRR